jgi:hypothetical protein
MNVIRDPDHSIIDTKMDESLLAEKAGSVTYHLICRQAAEAPTRAAVCLHFAQGTRPFASV